MAADIINGMEIRESILEELRGEVANLKRDYNVVPGLVTILVGNHPASLSYVTLKIKTAIELGFHEIQDNQSETITEEELIGIIKKYNEDPLIHGILVQLPLPSHINEGKVLHAIDPNKDVDGFHPMNLGRLVIGGNAITFLPCTPAGIQELLIRSSVETLGAEVVVIGRSNIVGRPISIMLTQKGVGGDATVTLVHTKSKNIVRHCQQADIVIAAVGVPNFVKAEWIKPGATVIDVGVNRIGFNEDTGKPILSGDVDFVNVSQVAGKITPVPGGVGPMTIAMLMRNTVRSAFFHLSL
ncbi:bifunctional methylenetetrahydrofolate dehydrogenase/methenyltetrahydrofolate cyclohydrolase FolD [Lawsonia intracellularis]|uniref:Bifunctional protein FolD n=1 Tax=Lawsonia intracellularis (strain PHE/MN1-00) TaxID=363253 RepID=FOLD_LAWIP|nr:bifunctional methylenetetrahydrofolate dehydrogenase/methenyltetrahydrofolate cyclohydrolase FolD [Lawsonia intracellularis]Q1MPZ8.1 RecName: Full=Bifunctional protein FolD; Includes: RecName: Full=Methylenetetrahydrofolate dehydrogenase; Includes: RecName: Full=Methenyltetrahydrofolate cyclohydrolase [Lawsonia intracellularis PHE/MN1-00]AGC50299.1 bifunctional 5,10-methylene-tetrahydrofolate dehydrogenase/ 5,10-methylene-tetrahydrofolate cyclohydrolase [Lawsonia intracellularis N343]KAA02043